MYIDDKIDKRPYEQSQKRFEIQLEALKSKEKTIQNTTDIFNTYRIAFERLSYFEEQYKNATVEDKRRLVQYSQIIFNLK